MCISDKDFNIDTQNVQSCHLWIFFTVFLFLFITNYLIWVKSLRGKWFLLANVDILNHQNKQAPTTKGYRLYFDSSASHIRMHPRQRLVLWNKAKPMLLAYQEETKQPRRKIAGLPTPWVLSSAGKLIQYLHGSYFLPYRNTVFTPDASSAAWQNTIEHYNQWCCLHWMWCGATAAEFYLWHIDTNFKWFSKLALSRLV